MLKRLGIEADVAVDGYEAVAAAGDRPNALDGDRERMLEAGMNDDVGKPVQLDDLAAALTSGGSQHGAAPADAGITG